MVESEEVNICLAAAALVEVNEFAESDIMKQSKSKNELVPRLRIIKPMSSWEV